MKAFYRSSKPRAAAWAARGSSIQVSSSLRPEQALQERLDVEGIHDAVAVRVAGAGVAGRRVWIEQQVEERFDVEGVYT